MIFTDRICGAIAAGEVRVVFRRWAVARVRSGTVVHTRAGLVRVDLIETVDPESLTDADARAAGETSLARLCAGLRGTATDTLFHIHVSYEGPDPRWALAGDSDMTGADIEEIDAHLATADRRASAPWTRRTLEVIADHPGLRAAGLAEILHVESVDRLKRRIRRLKALGLTQSLGVGYALSPRGHTYLHGRTDGHSRNDSEKRHSG
ncbi:hypothetical protein [Nocardia brevicatena]|uniref:hypothetical protein n=1 Tax=Nocardia brevicatena TaxID=37327 RepID=UPI0002DDD083|nr:hypothetical protein [Nocardia brevicatena]